MDDAEVAKIEAMVQRHTSKLIAGRYWAREVLGAGGLGAVYAGWDEQLQRPVAVKRLFEDAEYNQSHAEAAWNEAHALAKLQHPNIITLFDFGRDEEGVYYIMELAQGMDLEELLNERGAMKFDDFLALATQMLDGLAVAHSAGVLHLDLKASNIRVHRGADGRLKVKILDFGLSKFQPDVEDLPDDEDREANMGSIYYSAPEVILTKAHDHRADLYSAGHVFYQALAGHPAFGHLPMCQVLEAHVRHDPPPLRSIRKDLDRGLCEWVQRFINKDPNERPQSAAVALADLQLVRDYILAPQHSNFESPIGIILPNDWNYTTNDILRMEGQEIRLRGTVEHRDGTARIRLNAIEHVASPVNPPSAPSGSMNRPVQKVASLIPPESSVPRVSSTRRQQ